MVEHLGSRLRGPRKGAREGLGQRLEGELDRGDDAEAATAAPQRPEEVRLVVGVDADRLARRGDELDREHAVRGEAVPPAEPAEAAAEGEADDADVGGGAAERREPELAGADSELAGERAGGHPRPARGWIDLNPGHACGLQQDDVVQRAEGTGGVTRLHGDPQAVAASELDRRDHVIDSARVGDRRGVQIDGEVPCLAGRVPAFVAGGEDAPVKRCPQRLDVGLDRHLGFLPRSGFAGERS